MQTVQPLASALQLPVTVHPDVHEVQGFFGAPDARGLERIQIQEQFPGFDAALVPENGQGSETCAEAYARAKRVVQLLRTWPQNAEEEIVVIVSHCDFIGLLGRLLLVFGSGPAGVGPGDQINSSAEHFAEEMFCDSYWSMNNTGISHFILGAREHTQLTRTCCIGIEVTTWLNISAVAFSSKTLDSHKLLNGREWDGAEAISIQSFMSTKLFTSHGRPHLLARALQ